jgi:hypothetical protein
MTQAPIRSHVNVALDIHRHLTPQITLDLVSLIEDLTDLDHASSERSSLLRSKEIPACSRIFREALLPIP